MTNKRLVVLLAGLLLLALPALCIAFFYGTQRTVEATSPDGKTRAAVRADGWIHVWDIESGKEITAFEPFSYPDKVAGISFGSYGQRQCLYYHGVSGGSGPAVRVLDREPSSSTRLRGIRQR